MLSCSYVLPFGYYWLLNKERKKERNKQVMTAYILVTASNELGTRKRFKKPGSGCCGRRRVGLLSWPEQLKERFGDNEKIRGKMSDPKEAINVRENCKAINFEPLFGTWGVPVFSRENEAPRIHNSDFFSALKDSCNIISKSFFKGRTWTLFMS